MIHESWLHLVGALLAVTLVRGLAVFLLALAVTTSARKLAGETRHLIWLGVIASFMLIPLAWLLLPAIRIGAVIVLRPAAPLRIAAASVLSRGEYVLLIEKAREQAAMLSQVHAGQSGAGVPLVLVSAWLLGIAFLGARMLLGRGRLRKLLAAAVCDARLQSQADGLAAQFALPGRVPVLLSSLCRIPFAFGLLRPRILLPQEAAQWPAARLQAALTHELAHIRRRDLVSQTAGYAVCVLFWFVPLLWLAYAAMLREAETCCDQQVINRGFRGPEYAQDIVELARSCQGRILLPSISSAIGSKSLLKERIRRVLILEPGRRPFGTRAAARVLAICLACVVPILALTAQVRLAQDPLFGTWINEDYGTRKGSPQRVVIFADGRELDYMVVSDKEPYWEYRLQIENQWEDEEGNYWYTLSWTGGYYGYPQDSSGGCADKGFSLVKVDASNTTIESVWAESRIPDEEDWGLIPHPVYYRDRLR